ncbi:MAG TPA: VOC family protein [Bacillales bacterium]|nr:VOC family protein [Bacillales bacterium]
MSIHFVKLDHVQVCIPNGAEEEARVFYAGVLGLKEIAKPKALLKNGGLWFEAADVQLHIGTEEPKQKGKAHPAFQVSNVRAAKEHLIRSGVRTQEETPVPGVERFSFFDPFGNRIEMLEKC